MCGVRGRGGGGDSQTDPRLTPGQGPAEMTEAVIRGITHPQWFNIIFSIYDKLNYHRTAHQNFTISSPKFSTPAGSASGFSSRRLRDLQTEQDNL